MKGNQKVFRCPSQNADTYDWKQNDTTGLTATKAEAAYGYNLGETLMIESRDFSYGYNDWGSHDQVKNPQRGLGADIWSSSLGGVSEVKVAAVRNATELIVIADRSTVQNGGFNMCLDPGDPTQVPSTIHKGSANILHPDGHVDSKRQKDLILYDPANYIDRATSVWNESTGSPIYKKQFQTISPQWNTDNRP